MFYFAGVRDASSKRANQCTLFYFYDRTLPLPSQVDALAATQHRVPPRQYAWEAIMVCSPATCSTAAQRSTAGSAVLKRSLAHSGRHAPRQTMHVAALPSVGGGHRSAAQRLSCWEFPRRQSLPHGQNREGFHRDPKACISREVEFQKRQQSGRGWGSEKPLGSCRPAGMDAVFRSRLARGERGSSRGSQA